MCTAVQQCAQYCVGQHWGASCLRRACGGLSQAHGSIGWHKGGIDSDHRLNTEQGLSGLISIK